MDHYADDLAALTAQLNLKNAIHVGHSTGGGEVTRYIGRHGESRVAKAVLISAVPPLMVKTPANPGGLPKEVFDGFQTQTNDNRAQFFLDVPTGPFYGYNRPGAKASQGIIMNWWRQGMMGSAKAHSDGIVAFSQTDFTADLKNFTVPTLVMHGDDDQIVPYADARWSNVNTYPRVDLELRQSGQRGTGRTPGHVAPALRFGIIGGSGPLLPVHRRVAPS
jgi:non-heme chloroperoxidase